ncbi:ER membrane protein DP1/Yop1 [Tulasnella sp. JGI-2019a]|nr:ER membrane protein DP1/Yop1 [Tulasnella sp. JGI-2019a]
MSTVQDPSYGTTTNNADSKAKLNASVANTQNAASNAAATASSAAQNAAEQIRAHPAVQQAHQSFAQYMAQLDKELSKYPIINQLEQKTQVPKAYGALIAAVFFLSTIFINTLALPVSNLVGWALPAYLSYRAIETPATEDDVQWLTYWTVFGFFTFLESLALRPVLYYVPYYFPIKTAFVLWLQLPTTRGAVTFHHSVLKPVVNNVRGKRAAYAPSTVPDSYTTTSPYSTTQAPHEKLL